MDRCLKFKCKVEAVMAPPREVYEDMQKNVKRLKMTSFFIKSSVSHCAMQFIMFDQL